MTLPSGNKLFVGPIYHPHTTDINSMNEIKKNLEKAASFENQTVWVGGDFNLPDIAWKDLSNAQVKENGKYTEMHKDFIDHITDRGLVQLVNQIKENQTQRKVYQYKKADFETMNAEAKNFGNQIIINHQNSTDINKMWEEFKEEKINLLTSTYHREQ
ncbi:unnamed protein product [Mytilus edulis]|uniref:Endonuclease/exonuclease/phosphatase domain-containing protein n=1 Tax=Mytilus edulis TaxID=6550 RepID=A0A8S3VE74_MYTED|nr:unnamed protein product [Mytilus edulis]